MGCNCGGGRAAARSAAMAATGVPTAWRLFHLDGGTVDYYMPDKGQEAQRALQAKENQRALGLGEEPRVVKLTKVDTRTGDPIA
jgi:hypothetical protein